MKFVNTKIDGVYIIEVEPHNDERGFFARTFCAEEFGIRGLKTSMVQTNISYSKHRHTLRGMHYQTFGAEEVKLVRCYAGSVLDVIIDLRKESPTYLKYYSTELTETNNQMLYVPEGFAHGFLTLEDNTYLSYQVSSFYSPGKERGIRWNDTEIKIKWPVAMPEVISEKDSSWPDYNI